MKNRLIYYTTRVVLLLATAGLMACSPSDGDDTYYSIAPATNPVMAGPDQGAFSVEIVSTHPWSATSGSEWITDVTASGGSGEQLSFKVKSNDQNAFRDGAIQLTVTGSSYTKSLTVRQMGRDGGLIIAPNPVAFTTGGGLQEVIVYAMNGWKIDTVSDEWIVVKQKNNSAFSVSVEPNYTGAPLSGSITLKDGEGKKSYTIPVTQEFDAGLFLGAKTVLGRRFVYNAQGMVYNVQQDVQYAIDEHVSVLEIGYLGTASGVLSPYRLFVFNIELGYDATIATTTADDEDSSIKTTDATETKAQIIRAQLAAMQNKRSTQMTVLGGVNGDFFFGAGVSGSDRKNLLQGVAHRRGVCLKETFDGGQVCTVFAVMKDGSARCMTQAQYSAAKSTIQEALGGRQHLLNGGTPVSSDASLEPRTAVGVSKDGRSVSILVIDGRRDGYSIGASYAMMAKMFLAVGMSDAINLDGGGSSTFALRKEGQTTITAESFETRNRPTDNTGDREVVNGLAVVKMKK